MFQAHTPLKHAGEPDAFVRGTLVGSAAIAGVAAIGVGVWGSWAWAIGFAVGALISLGNFHLIASAVGGAAGADGTRAARTLWKGSIFRFGISGVVLIVALLVLRVSLPALVAGLLITQVSMVVLWLMRALRSLT